MQPGARDKHAVTLADGDVNPIRLERGGVRERRKRRARNKSDPHADQARQ